MPQQQIGDNMMDKIQVGIWRNGDGWFAASHHFNSEVSEGVKFRDDTNCLVRKKRNVAIKEIQKRICSIHGKKREDIRWLLGAEKMEGKSPDNVKIIDIWEVVAQSKDLSDKSCCIISLSWV